MAYKIKARYYADDNQFGESYIVISDNTEKDKKLKIGQKVMIIPIGYHDVDKFYKEENK